MMREEHIKKTRIEIDIEIVMNTLKLITVIDILLSNSIFKFDNLRVWLIFFALMGILLIKGVNNFIRVLISTVALGLFLLDLDKIYPSLVIQILQLLIVYISFYIMIRRKFNLELIENSLAIGTTIKVLYTNPSIISGLNINQNLLFYVFIGIIFLLIVPVLEDIARLIIAILATISLLALVYSQIPFLSFLILLTSLVFYLTFSFRVLKG